jgi:hypothetical protein
VGGGEAAIVYVRSAIRGIFGALTGAWWLAVTIVPSVSLLDPPRLRRCVLAVSVMSDLDLTPHAEGVLLPGRSGAFVDWAAIGQAVGDFDPFGSIARRRVETLLRLHRLVVDLGEDAVPAFHAASRVIALPAGHAEHPGAGWAQETLRGEVLELGIGAHGLLGELEWTTPVPPSVLRALGVDGRHWWPRLREHVDRMGALSAARLRRDGGAGLIRPVGGCDVLALLSSRTLRRHVAQSDGSGMRSVALPTRRRGWYDISRIDPQFVQAAWSMTDDVEQGLPQPVLVTADDVTLPFAIA